MAVIVPIKFCQGTGTQGRGVQGLPNEARCIKRHTANIEPGRPFCQKALKAWEEDRQRNVVIRFALARCGNA